MRNIPSTMTISSAVKDMPSLAMETMVTPITAMAIVLLIFPNFTMNPPLQSPRSLLDLFTGTSVYNAPAQSPGQIQTQKIRDAIAHNETRGVPGDPYSYSRPSGSPAAGQALGKYQVTEGTLKTLAPKYLGQQVTPQQFLSNPAYQDNFMNARIAELSKQGYTPPQIADIHRGGGSNYPFSPGATTYRNPTYVNSFNSAYLGTTTPATALSTPRTVQGLTTP